MAPPPPDWARSSVSTRIDAGPTKPGMGVNRTFAAGAALIAATEPTSAVTGKARLRTSLEESAAANRISAAEIDGQPVVA